jgi:single-stranded DNA-binding protein
MDEASFYIIGTVASGPLWAATKSGKNILELRFAVRRQGANGNAYDDLIQVRFRRDPEQMARLLPYGTRAMVCGEISGRLWKGANGEKVFTDILGERVVVIATPSQQMPVIGPEDIRPIPPPPPVQAQAAPQAQNMSDVPF